MSWRLVLDLAVVLVLVVMGLRLDGEAVVPERSPFEARNPPGIFGTAGSAAGVGDAAVVSLRHQSEE